MNLVIKNVTDAPVQGLMMMKLYVEPRNIIVYLDGSFVYNNGAS